MNTGHHAGGTTQVRQYVQARFVGPLQVVKLTGVAASRCASSGWAAAERSASTKRPYASVGVRLRKTASDRVGVRAIRPIQELLGQACLANARLAHQCHRLAVGLYAIKSLPQGCHLSIHFQPCADGAFQRVESVRRSAARAWV